MATDFATFDEIEKDKNEKDIHEHIFSFQRVSFFKKDLYLCGNDKNNIMNKTSQHNDLLLSVVVSDC